MKKVEYEVDEVRGGSSSLSGVCRTMSSADKHAQQQQQQLYVAPLQPSSGPCAGAAAGAARVSAEVPRRCLTQHQQQQVPAVPTQAVSSQRVNRPQLIDWSQRPHSAAHLIAHASPVPRNEGLGKGLL